MLFKIAFFAIFIGFLFSLGSGLFFLFSDDGESKKRVYNSLAVRVSLAVLFIIVLTYGVMTGQIRSKAPWAGKGQIPASTEAPAKQEQPVTTEKPAETP